MTIRRRLVAASRLLVLLAAYSAVLAVSLLLALLFRFDFFVPAEFWRRFFLSLSWILPLKLLLLGLFGQFRSLLTFFSLPDAKKIALAMGIAALVEMVVWFVFQGSGVVPRGVIVSDLVVSFLGLAGLRTLLRLNRERVLAPSGSQHGPRRRAAIVGTGASAAMLLRDIQSRHGLGIEVACVIDDDPEKIGGTLHGQPIVGPTTRLPEIAKSVGLQKIIIAMPEARPSEIRSLVSTVNELGLEHDILPSVAQLLHRKVTVTHLRRVEAEDLLGREQVALDEEGITDLVKNASVMVTGAGGSIGAELCRQLADRTPARIILVERSEPALFSVLSELRSSHAHIETVARAFDVCREEQMAQLFADYRPDLVFHAAAHKHVPLMEEQPTEALRNNVFGTAVVARLAARHGTRKFVLISTDKAVNPTSVMGATKRLAEMVVAEQQAASGDKTVFSAVRFGNVLGSSGSVVPIFRKQIAEGGPVTVTHPEVTRFFMSIPEAVGLILQSAMQSRNGEVFVLDMGDAVKIRELARQMIELSGFAPDEDIEITYVGLRPGEKLHEEPIHADEEIETTVHPKVRLLRDSRNIPVGVCEEVATLCRGAAADASVRVWIASKLEGFTA